jgi:hypothetical protein
MNNITAITAENITQNVVSLIKLSQKFYGSKTAQAITVVQIPVLSPSAD